MPIEFRCSCGAKFKAPDRLAGKSIACRRCHEVIEVPLVGTGKQQGAFGHGRGGAERGDAQRTQNRGEVGSDLVPARPVRPAGQGRQAQPAGKQGDASLKRKVAPAKKSGSVTVPSKPTLKKRPVKSVANRAPQSGAVISTKSSDVDLFADLPLPQVTSTGAQPAQSGYWQTPQKKAKKKGETQANLLLLLGITGGVGLGVVLIIVAAWLIGSMGSSERDSQIASSGEQQWSTADPASTKSVSTSDGGSRLVSNITESAALETAQRFVSAVRQNNTVEVNRIFDIREIVERACADIDPPQEFKDGFFRGFSRQNEFTHIAILVTQGADYSVLRAKQIEGEWRVIVRLELPDSITFHELSFIRLGGQWKIRDIAFYASGISLQQTISRMATLALASDPSFMQKLAGDKGEFVENIGKLKQIQVMSQTQPEAALRLFRQLPQSLRKERNIRAVQLQIAQNAGPDVRRDAVGDYLSVFPDGVTADLLSIDYYALRGEIQKSRQAAERVNDYVGGDPFLDELIEGLRQLE